MSGNEMKTPLYKAMKYGLLNGGKRIRPYIVCEFSRMLEIPKKSYQFKYKGRKVFSIAPLNGLESLDDIYRLPTEKDIIDIINFQNKMLEKKFKNK